MPNNNTITVVVPALNEEPHLARAVSVMVEALDRWFEDYEILVFNDGSTDNTGEIADSLANGNERIYAFHHESPKNIGGVIRSGLEKASMHYFIWIDGKGATPTEALDRIFALKGKADLVAPYTLNQNERHIVRQFISWAFRTLLNTLFQLKLQAYTHLVLCETKTVKQLEIKTNSYAYQAESLIKLIYSGCSYIQVGVMDRFDIEDRRTKAFKLPNVMGVVSFFINIFSDIYIKPFPQKSQDKGTEVLNLETKTN